MNLYHRIRCWVLGQTHEEYKKSELHALLYRVEKYRSKKKPMKIKSKHFV